MALAMFSAVQWQFQQHLRCSSTSTRSIAPVDLCSLHTEHPCLHKLYLTAATSLEAQQYLFSRQLGHASQTISCAYYNAVFCGLAIARWQQQQLQQGGLMSCTVCRPNSGVQARRSCPGPTCCRNEKPPSDCQGWLLALATVLYSQS